MTWETFWYFMHLASYYYMPAAVLTHLLVLKMSEFNGTPTKPFGTALLSITLGWAIWPFAAAAAYKAWKRAEACSRVQST